MIISQLRQQLTSGLLQWIILFICLGMAISLVIPGGRSPQQDSAGISEWVVRVNGTEVSRAQYNLQLDAAQRRLEMLRAQLGSVADQLFGAINTREMALSGLIASAVLDHAVHNSNLGVDPITVLRTIARTVPTDFLTTEGLPDLAKIAPLLPAGLTVEQWIADESRQIVHDQYMALTRAAGFVPTMAIAYEQNQNSQKSRYSYGVLKDQDFKAKIEKESIGDDVLRELYDKKTLSESSFWTPELRTGRVWEISPRSYNIAVTDQDIAEYYDRVKQKRFIATPARVTGLLATSDSREEALELKKNPELFEKKATKIVLSKDSTGIPQERIKALFTIAQDKNFSGVYQCNNGFEVVQRLSKTPEQFVPLSTVSAQIRAELEAQRFGRLFTKDIRIALDNDEALEYVTTHEGALSTVTAQAADKSSMARELFSKTMGQWGFYIDNKHGYVFVVDSIEKPRKKKFAEVRNILRDEYILERVRSAREEAVRNALDSHRLSEIAIENSEPISRTELAALLTKKQIAVPESSLRQLRTVGDIVAVPVSQGTALIRVAEVTPLKAESLSISADAIQQKYGSLPEQGLIAAAHQQATIERNIEL